MTALIPWLAAGMGTLVSPDHLRLWGNLAGRIGPGFWMVALAAAVIYALSGNSYRRLSLVAKDGGGYLSGLRMKGGIGAVALALASRLILTAGLSTGILVTAGFVFNETFIYWFPNFAFAFICLACVTLALLWGYTAAEKVQGTLLAITVLGLSILIIIGWLQTGPRHMPDVRLPSGFDLRAAVTGLLLFVGFDLGFHRNEKVGNAARSTRTMPVVLGLTILLLGLWGAVSLAYVPAERLAGTFIPFSLAARGISGQTGRIIIGIVLIAGTGCAVTTLFSTTARVIGSLAKMNLLPQFFRGSDRRNIPATAVLAATVTTMMAVGFAGEPELEVFIRAGFLLWLLHAALVHLLASGTDDRSAPDTADPPLLPGRWPGITAGLLLTAGAVCLWATDAEWMLLLTYLCSTWTGAALALFFAHLVNRRKGL